MNIIVAAPDALWNELVTEKEGIKWNRVKDAVAFANHPADAVYFNLMDDAACHHYPASLKMVIINSVNDTLLEKKLSENVCRINAWPGFLLKDTWEITGKDDALLPAIFIALDKKIVMVQDEPGFIAARILAMIINEAYFALADEVSTKKEIDIAMKLGTNYPKGPFEWSEEIGIKKIHTLLLKLSKSDERYLPSPLLTAASK
ncbi:MAG: 3-hydroxyacyl-CoA dehydrogenase family protein [Ferruginibacter sp.]